ncbi:hypothetical protein CEXT_529951 [Caerostris extrusa]|uniref:Uncharacterized protein n=1 Tax=Caerostris extrusa TaxID=172846 RepID=A0AAV4VBG6_CAEEX|nr:hypothetical protein CEXT_529951 [Caerostris extrusa]
MGVAQIMLDELDLSNFVISWYKLFHHSSLVNLPTSVPQNPLMNTSTVASDLRHLVPKSDRIPCLKHIQLVKGLMTLLDKEEYDQFGGNLYIFEQYWASIS